MQQEGCAEQQILTTDASINVLYKSIFARLSTDHARRDLISAARDWFEYRQADCLSLSDVFQGGSEAPVLDARCEASRNLQRLKDLRTFLRDLGS